MKSLRLITAFSAAVILLPPATAQAEDRFANPLFDQPVRIQTVSLPADPKAHGKGDLTCLYYPDMMVKEAFYEDHKGAVLLSVTRLEKGKPIPPCRFRRAKDERLIEHWGNYFLGAKMPYLVFGSDYGAYDDGGFVVYHVSDTRSAVFGDAGVLQSVELTMPRRESGLSPWRENPLRLRYRRAYLTSCSLWADAEGCWRSIQQVTGLTGTPPDCSESYGEYEKWINENASGPRREEWLADLHDVTYSGYIDYDVETIVDGSTGVIRSIPVGPAVACYLGP
jgi:hypothetical protein